jgi:iron-sulfur cluster repair protein YtfE (RIC family)
MNEHLPITPDTPVSAIAATYPSTLRTLEGDIHRHIHLENNILFPRVQALLRARREAA